MVIGQIERAVTPFKKCLYVLSNPKNERILVVMIPRGNAANINPITHNKHCTINKIPAIRVPPFNDISLKKLMVM